MNSLQWFQFILSYFVQASLVIGTAWAIERWTRAAEIKTRIWTGCFVSLLGLLAMGLMLPRLHWIHPWSRLGRSDILTVANAEQVLGRSLLAIWLLGCCVMLTRWVFRFIAVRRFIRSCPEPSEDDSSRLCNLACGEPFCPGGRPITFRISPEDLGPFCYQFHQPIIFLPLSLVQGDATELQHVLHHEFTHLKTHHPMQLFAQKAVQALVWFHPLVWISGKRACLVREFVCDDAATCEEASTASYLRTLLHIVERRGSAHGNTLSLGRSPSELKLRARRLASPSARGVSRWGPLSSVGVFASAAIASQLWLPTNPLSSAEANYSPWPSWSAAALHTFDLSVRDFERFEARLQIHELLEDRDELSSDDF